jgi:tRNA/rRNA methyltransferase
VLQSAFVATSLAESVAAATLVIGTGTLEYRKPEQPVVSLPDLAPLVAVELARGGRVALVFGSEKHGLTRDDLALCHLLVEIPTDPEQPSMNLGQAVAVCLYELSARGPSQVSMQVSTRVPAHLSAAAPAMEPAAARAASARLELLAKVVDETMAASDYSPAAMRAANHRDLHTLLRRLTLTDRDTRRILGLFRRILWRLRFSMSSVPHRLMYVT